MPGLKFTHVTCLQLGDGKDRPGEFVRVKIFCRFFDDLGAAEKRVRVTEHQSGLKEKRLGGRVELIVGNDHLSRVDAVGERRCPDTVLCDRTMIGDRSRQPVDVVSRLRRELEFGFSKMAGQTCMANRSFGRNVTRPENESSGPKSKSARFSSGSLPLNNDPSIFQRRS